MFIGVSLMIAVGFAVHLAIKLGDELDKKINMEKDK
jgi:hypothetical protein